MFFHEEELHQYYDSMEYLIVKEFAEKEEKHSSSQTDIIFESGNQYLFIY